MVTALTLKPKPLVHPDDEDLPEDQQTVFYQRGLTLLQFQELKSELKKIEEDNPDPDEGKEDEITPAEEAALDEQEAAVKAMPEGTDEEKAEKEKALDAYNEAYAKAHPVTMRKMMRIADNLLGLVGNAWNRATITNIVNLRDEDGELIEFVKPQEPSEPCPQSNIDVIPPHVRSWLARQAITRNQLGGRVKNLQ